MIKEDFLHYLWKYKLFDFSQLNSLSNEDIVIINSGTHNHNAGPDFFNAKIKIGNQLWAGNVEIHLKSSDWYVHNHEQDISYDNVILHVVWEDDMQIFRQDNSVITTLELRGLVKKDLLYSYQILFSKQQVWINCENEISKVDPFIFNNWKERLYYEKLNNKSEKIVTLLKQSNNDWEAVLFKLFVKNFGLQVNGDSFFSLANSFDFSVFRKCQSNVITLEALLFGQASMLPDELNDFYLSDLKHEYAFLQVKYKLKPIHKGEIKFFRLRPNNFPTIRLSQLANLYTTYPNLFSRIISIEKLKDYYTLFDIETSVYWQTHYSFKSVSNTRKKRLTKSFIDLLLVNTIIPVLFVYNKYLGKNKDDLILNLIQQIKSEKNSIIDKFKAVGVCTNNAMDTQALIQLKNEYCIAQKCLQCAVGNSLLST